MVIHNIELTMHGQSNVSVDAIVVRAPSQLAAALSQRTKAVVIDNEELERKFSRVERWRARENTYRFIAALIAALFALAISYRYQIDVSWHYNWKLERIDGKITLTPTSQLDK